MKRPGQKKIAFYEKMGDDEKWEGNNKYHFLRQYGSPRALVPRLCQEDRRGETVPDTVKMWRNALPQRGSTGCPQSTQRVPNPVLGTRKHFAEERTFIGGRLRVTGGWGWGKSKNERKENQENTNWLRLR